MVLAVNILLEELNKRNAPIVDWENPDMFIDHLEYHAADSIQNGKTVPGMGDKSDAYNALVEIYNESTLSMKDIASLLIIEGSKHVVYDKEE